MVDEMQGSAEAVRKANVLVSVIKDVFDLPLAVDDLRKLPVLETALRMHLLERQKAVSRLFVEINQPLAGHEHATALWAAVALVGVLIDQAPEEERSAMRLAIFRALSQMGPAIGGLPG